MTLLVGGALLAVAQNVPTVSPAYRTRPLKGGSGEKQ